MEKSNTDLFNIEVEKQIEKCKEILITKAKEYATEDRFHNFRSAAVLQDVSVIQALAGFMAKHTVSIYDMIWDGEFHEMDQWEEKITDNINYLLLLKALIWSENVEDSDSKGENPIQNTEGSFGWHSTGHLSEEDIQESSWVERRGRCEEVPPILVKRPKT